MPKKKKSDTYETVLIAVAIMLLFLCVFLILRTLVFPHWWR